MRRSWMLWMSTMGGRSSGRSGVFSSTSQGSSTGFASASASASTSTCLSTLRELLTSIQGREKSVLLKRVTVSSRDSEVCGATVPQLSSALCQQYLDLEQDSEKRAVFYELAVNAGPKFDLILELIDSISRSSRSTSEENTGIVLQRSSIRKLRETCKPKYEGLFETVLAEAEHCVGMNFLIALRQDLMAYIRLNSSDSAKNMVDSHTDIQALKDLDFDLQRMLAAWFSSGILELRRITFDRTPASIIETIARKEAVHPISDLDDLKQRLGKNRRCYAFFHPSLPNEPLVFIHVALLPIVAESMTEIKNSSINGGDPNPACAIFYSINSTQKGLSGVELGTFLIKRVCSMLHGDYPGLKTFCTLSPIPNFRKWLKSKLLVSGKFADETLLSEVEKLNIATVLNCTKDDVQKAFLFIVRDNQWINDP